MRLPFILTIALLAEYVARWLRDWSDPAPGHAETDAVPGAPVFRISQVRKSYPTRDGAKQVLRGATADIGEGLTCVLGASGDGKSTLLNILGALTVPDEGAVWLRGRPMPTDEAGQRLLRATKIGWVFQANNLIGHLTAEANVALPLLLRGVPRRAAAEAARRALDKFRIGPLARTLPRHMSGGEIQRVAIARALVAEPAVILADEPTGNLDEDSAAVVMAAFTDAAFLHGTPVVMVTHNEAFVRKYATRIFRCEKGVLTADPGVKVAVAPAPAPAPTPVLTPRTKAVPALFRAYGGWRR